MNASDNKLCMYHWPTWGITMQYSKSLIFYLFKKNVKSYEHFYFTRILIFPYFYFMRRIFAISLMKTTKKKLRW